MARIRRKKALYEVISRSRLKINSAKPTEAPQTEPQRPEKVEVSETEDTDTVETADSGAAVQQKRAYWPRKPRLVQFNADRIELSVTYPVAVAAVLVAVALALACYRLGQYSSSAAEQPAGPIIPSSETLGQPPAAKTPEAPTPFVPDTAKKTTVPETPVSTGSNVIILAQCENRKDLEPVVQHFAKYNIVLEIRQKGSRYFLVTKKRYDSTGKGTEGGKDLENIIRIGALYKDKAPPGYGTFAPHYFSDAYAAKVWY